MQVDQCQFTFKILKVRKDARLDLYDKSIIDSQYEEYIG